MSELYQSRWNPKGVRKNWERCALGESSVAASFGKFHTDQNSPMKGAVCWLDDDGAARRIVADYENGKRLDMSIGSRGSIIRFGRHTA